MNSFQLKILACVSMLIDHITYCFIPRFLPDGTESVLYYVGRCIGRSSFIIICFLLVEGFFHTKNIKKYMLRLFIAAVISEAPFDLMGKRLNSTDFYKLQNVLFLLCLGLLIIYVLNQLNEIYIREQNSSGMQAGTYMNKPFIKYNILAALTCIFGSLIAYFSNVDYGVFGLVLILIFYYFRYRKGMLVAVVIAWALSGLFLSHMLEWAGIIALIPIAKLYNGEKGKNGKWFFYIFFPAHLLILGIIRLCI